MGMQMKRFRQFGFRWIFLLAAFLLGEGASTLSHAEDPNSGLFVMVSGFLVIGMLIVILDLRARRAVLAEKAALAARQRGCLFELRVYRGEVTNAADGTPVEGATALSVRARTLVDSVDLGQLAEMVEHVARDLDRRHHERVSAAN